MTVKLKRKTTCKPREIHTDKWIIEIYPADGIFKFYKPTIYMGEIVKRKSPAMVLCVKDFKNFKGEYETMVEYMGEFMKWL